MIPNLSSRTILITTIAALWLATAAAGGWYYWRYTSTASTLSDVRDNLAREREARRALEEAREASERSVAALQKELAALSERKQQVIRRVVVRQPGDDAPIAPVMKRTLEALRDE